MICDIVYNMKGRTMIAKHSDSWSFLVEDHDEHLEDLLEDLKIICVW